MPYYSGSTVVRQLLTVLGVTYNSELRFDCHVAHIIDKAARNLHGLKTLRGHRYWATGQSLWDVTEPHAAPSWWGLGIPEHG